MAAPTDMRYVVAEITKSGVRVSDCFRDNLIIDRYDPVLATMRASKLEHIRSENSEDAVTWNVFRSLRQIDPSVWLPALARRGLPGVEPPPADGAVVSLWPSSQPPPALTADGDEGSPISTSQSRAQLGSGSSRRSTGVTSLRARRPARTVTRCSGTSMSALTTPRRATSTSASSSLVPAHRRSGPKRLIGTVTSRKLEHASATTGRTASRTCGR